mmetsp:Transcript_41902/g.81927  ORF Transcript_41902/g.81927 Transcript_41902/m.81927 type:complete len:207 (-) Transcript_41902:2153-2773(-)
MAAEIASDVSKASERVARERGTTVSTVTSSRGLLLADCRRTATANSRTKATLASCMCTPATVATAWRTIMSPCVDVKSARNMFHTSRTNMLRAATHVDVDEDSDKGVAYPTLHAQSHPPVNPELSGMEGQSAQEGEPDEADEQSGWLPMGQDMSEHETHCPKPETSLKNPASHSHTHESWSKTSTLNTKDELAGLTFPLQSPHQLS